jgi:hypothetical protein
MVRAIRLEQLGWAFGADREFGFTAWTLATPDPLAAVLAPGYFRHCATRFRPGDLLFCATGQPGAGAGVAMNEETARHRCLLLVTRIGAGEVEVRMAQDWGSPTAAPVATEGGPPGGVARGRGGRGTPPRGRRAGAAARQAHAGRGPRGTPAQAGAARTRRCRPGAAAEPTGRRGRGRAGRDGGDRASGQARSQGSGAMIRRLARLLRRRPAAPAPEERLAALERALGAKLEAQLVVLAQVVAEVVTRELARSHGELRRELAGQRAGNDGAAAHATVARSATASLLERVDGLRRDGIRAGTARAMGARP